MACTYPSKDRHPDSSCIIKNHLKYFRVMLLEITIYIENFSAQHHIEPAYTSKHIYMDPVNYWLMAGEYSIWNATVAALQFWTADLTACMLSSAIEQVYNTFFYSTSTYILHQQSDEVLFSCFVTTLNTTFENKLALEDRGYDSGSKIFNIPTPLRLTSKIHHVFSEEHASFNPDPVMPCCRGIRELPCRLVCRCLTFSSSEDDDEDTSIDETPSAHNTPPVQHQADTFQKSLSK